MRTLKIILREIEHQIGGNATYVITLLLVALLVVAVFCILYPAAANMFRDLLQIQKGG